LLHSHTQNKMHTQTHTQALSHTHTHTHRENIYSREDKKNLYKLLAFDSKKNKKKKIKHNQSHKHNKLNKKQTSTYPEVLELEWLALVRVEMIPNKHDGS